MGYCTDYELTTQNNITNKQILDILKYILKENKENEDYLYPFISEIKKEIADVFLEDINDFYFSASGVKWYNYEEELLKLSQNFPDIIFKLSGKGEQYSDMWDKYFYKGKIQKCYAKIIIPEFDINKFE